MTSYTPSFGITCLRTKPFVNFFSFFVDCWEDTNYLRLSGDMVEGYMPTAGADGVANVSKSLWNLYFLCIKRQRSLLNLSKVDK